MAACRQTGKVRNGPSIAVPRGPADIAEERHPGPAAGVHLVPAVIQIRIVIKPEIGKDRGRAVVLTLRLGDRLHGRGHSIAPFRVSAGRYAGIPAKLDIVGDIVIGDAKVPVFSPPRPPAVLDQKVLPCVVISDRENSMSPLFRDGPAAVIVDATRVPREGAAFRHQHRHADRPALQQGLQAGHRIGVGISPTAILIGLRNLFQKGRTAAFAGTIAAGRRVGIAGFRRQACGPYIFQGIAIPPSIAAICLRDTGDDHLLGQVILKTDVFHHGHSGKSPAGTAIPLVLHRAVVCAPVDRGKKTFHAWPERRLVCLPVLRHLFRDDESHLFLFVRLRHGPGLLLCPTAGRSGWDGCQQQHHGA